MLDRHREFYPPEAVRQGIPWDQLVVVHAANEPDHHWAMDQALGCPAVAAVLAWPERLDTRTFRRWQLAVEKGGAVGLLVRPEAVRHEPSWAEIRLGIEPLPSSGSSPGRRLRIHLLRCRGGNAGKRIDVEIDDETHSVYLVSGLAAPTPRKRAAGA